MRPKKHKKIQKHGTKTKINKKKKTPKSTRHYQYHNNVPTEHNINEALRVKSSCESCKLVPRDSCEVYRERRRRVERETVDTGHSTDGSRTRDDRRVKKEPKNTRRSKRRSSGSSGRSGSRSCCCSCSTMSTSSCASCSDMEY